MKRMILAILIISAFICGTMGQNNAMFVYRNDGAINAFLKIDVDSLRYSQLDLDSIFHKDYVVQEVWTADSVYRIPLSAIDSISFVTPPTIYKNDVTRLDEDLCNYIIGCDSLTLKLKTATPSSILPKSGDKLVMVDGCEALPYGFSGIVSEVCNGNEGIDIICEQAYLEDLFDSFCSVTTMYGSEDNEPTYVKSHREPNKIMYRPDDLNFKLGPFVYDVTGEISQGISPDGNLALKGGLASSLSVQPTFRVHTFLIMGEGQGIYFNCSITGDITIESKSSIYGGMVYSKELEFERMKLQIPIHATANLVNFYFVPGFVGRIDATISGSMVTRDTYSLGMAYDSANVIKPTLKCPHTSSSSELEVCVDGSVAIGAFLETGFNLLSRDLSKVCVRGELGVQANGSLVLLNSDIKDGEKKTRLYERLKASSIDTGPFGNVSLQFSALDTVISATYELSAALKKWDIVPTFFNTDFKRYSNSAMLAIATTEMHGDCLFPIPIGFKLFDEDNNEVSNYDATVKYTNKGGILTNTFTGVNDYNSYTLYPKVKFFGFDILASPSAELDKEEELYLCPDDNHPHAIDLGLPSGTKWSCCNVGASSPEESGGYYAWGEVNEKNLYDFLTYIYLIYDEKGNIVGYNYIGSDISGTQYDVANVKTGRPWRMPTINQFLELQAHCTTKWIQLNGIEGILIRGINNGKIFIPASGYHHGDKDRIDHLYEMGTGGFYWLSSLNLDDILGSETYVYGFGFNKNWGMFKTSSVRGLGQSVRPVCNW